MERTQYRVEADRGERRHIEGGADVRSSSPAGARAPQLAAVTGEGGDPTRAAICRRVSVPSSGNSATSVKVSVGPTPGTLRSSSSRSRQTGLSRSRLLRSSSISFNSCLSSVSTRSIRTWTTGSACPRRTCSAALIRTTCLRRVTRASSSRARGHRARLSRSVRSPPHRSGPSWPAFPGSGQSRGPVVDSPLRSAIPRPPRRR